MTHKSHKHNQQNKQIQSIIHVMEYNDELEGDYFDFLSFDRHDGLFVKTAFKKLGKIMREQQKKKRIKIWCDCGPHFRSYEVLHDCLVLWWEQNKLEFVSFFFSLNNMAKVLVMHILHMLAIVLENGPQVNGLVILISNNQSKNSLPKVQYR